MFHFFRTIRRKLIEDQKIRTYTWYALGEILLVSIGILIAVQVNLALEKSKNNEVRKQLVSGLKIEFQQNLTQMDTVISKHRRVLQSGNELINLMAERGDPFNENQVYDLISDITNLWTFNPTNGVLNSSISAGEIHLLKNDSLKIKLFSWKGIVDDASEEQLRANDHYLGYIVPYLDQHISVGLTLKTFAEFVQGTSFKSEVTTIMNNQVFENLLVTRGINTVDVLIELDALHDLNQEILTLLNEQKN